MVAEVVHGAPYRFTDPARFSFAHGGKDRHPFPVPLRVYDETIRVLKSAVSKARLGREEELGALKRLDAQARLLEHHASGPHVEELIAAFTPEYFARVRGFGLEAEEPVCIVGMPRSGSSLVEQILAHHPEVAGAGELRDVPRLVAEMADRAGGPAAYPECVARLDADTAGALAERAGLRSRPSVKASLEVRPPGPCSWPP